MSSRSSPPACADAALVSCRRWKRNRCATALRQPVEHRPAPAQLPAVPEMPSVDIEEISRVRADQVEESSVERYGSHRRPRERPAPLLD
jgi:hypothetical protein